MYTPAYRQDSVCARNINIAVATQFQLEFCLVLIDDLSLTIIKFSLRCNTGGEVKGPWFNQLGISYKLYAT